jgi:two-component system nitrate/nitrite response regulator NarL
MTQVVIVADICLYRDGLAELLAREPEIDIAGTASDLEGAIEQVHKLQPDVVLLDLSMPEGALGLRALAEANPSTRVVALTVPETAREVIDCAEAGVAGYVTREGSVRDVIAAVQGAARGDTPCSPRIAGILLRHVTALAGHRSPSRKQNLLTRRELQVVSLIDQGLTNKEIAQRLFIEVTTVKNHVHNILDKLHVRRRTEAVARLRTDRMI